jgi:hypothetical protein
MTTPSANWNVTTIDGVKMLVINTAQFRVPLDWSPDSNMFLAVAAPNAAVPIGTGGFPALVTGAPGPAPIISPIINFTPLAFGSSTPDSASWSVIGTNQYQLNLALHLGATGLTGPSAAVMSAADVVGSGSAIPTQMLVVNPSATGFVYASQRVGDRFVPASIASCPSGNSFYTLCSVPIPAWSSDWRPEVAGFVPITPTGLNVTVDLVARLNNATTGNEVGRISGLPAGSWLTGPTPYTLSLESVLPSGSPDSWDRVAKGSIATVYLNLERQTGSDTFTSVGSASRFKVRVAPTPYDL